jgi:hypothetical protein
MPDDDEAPAPAEVLSGLVTQAQKPAQVTRGAMSGRKKRRVRISTS